MKREHEFWGSACCGCEREVEEGTRNEDMVFWEIFCYEVGSNKERFVGWMTNKKITYLESIGRVHKSLSSTSCNLHFLEGINSYEQLDEFLKRDDPLREIILTSYRHFETFVAKLKD